MSDFPCKNQNCKSFGTPHPNCKCYGGYSDGGKIGHFCYSKKSHQNDCEYFSEGGEAPPPSFEATQPVSEATPSFDQTQPLKETAPSFEDTSPINEDKYGSYGQQALGVGESLSKGAAGHTLTALAERGLTNAGVPGLTPEDQAGREAYLKSVNPLIPMAGEAAGFGAGILSGTGEAALVGKLGEGAVALAHLGQSGALGQKLLAGATRVGSELAALSADNEVSKAINGTSKGVGDAISNIGLAGILGAAGGGAFKGTGIATKGALDSFGLNSFVDRLALKGTLAAGENLPKASGAGEKLADALYEKLNYKTLGEAAGQTAGQAILPGIGGHYLGKVISPAFASIIKPIVENMPNFPAYQGAINFAKAVAQGNSKLVGAAEDLFGGTTKVLSSDLIPDSKSILDLDDTLKEKQNDHASVLNTVGDLPHYLPDHAQELAKTSMNAVNYLNSQRPVGQKPGILDDEIPPSKQQQVDYERKLAVAEQPLSVLQHVKQGTLLPQDLGTLKAIYPEYYDRMSQQVMTAMNDHLHNKGSIPYRVKQGLSLFLGQPMDSTMTPSSIQAIQSTFAQSGSQQQPQGKQGKGSASKLNKVASNLETPSQARESRQNKA